MKKRGFGAGRWNGFGGKVNEGETVEEAAARELYEEAGIQVYADRLERIGSIEFDFEEGSKPLEVHIFKALEWQGEPRETEEMRPQWFHVDEIPFGEMWSDDPYWMPHFLKGRRFKARFLFDQPSTAEYNARILEKEVNLL
jgi:8-oxo-dGTP diphosphatase/2-hydroxy-dATP diphosphatase